MKDRFVLCEKKENFTDGIIVIQESGVIHNPYNSNLLSAKFWFRTNVPVKYSFRVKGKTPDTDLVISSEDYTTETEIPVIGLYGDQKTSVEYSLTAESGSVLTNSGTYSAEDQDFTGRPLKINLERLDETIAGNTIDNGWFVTAWFNGYDKNGDLRLAGIYDWANTPLKARNGSVIAAGGIQDLYLANELYATNLLGKIYTRYPAPEGYGFHHDVTWDPSGEYLYALAGSNEEATSEKKLEGAIIKYRADSGEMIWLRDYSQQFTGTTVLWNTYENDVHFNSIDFHPELNQLILDSRSTSTVLGIDEETGDILWTIDDPSYPPILPDTNLTAINPEKFVYPNGEHTSFLTHNPKYASYWGENKFVISIFDNVSCKYEDGKDKLKLMEDPYVIEYDAYPFPSPVLIYAIDLNNRTVELLDIFEVEGKRSEWRASVFDTMTDYYSVFFSHDFSFYVIDAKGKVGVRVTDLFEQDITYRGRIFSYDELLSLL